MNLRRGVDPALVTAFLKRCEQNHRTKTYLAIGGGAILSLVGPMLITVSFLTISLPMILKFGFWGTYALVAAVSLPVLFLLAYSVKGSILENQMPDGDSFGGRFVQRRVVGILLIAEIANIGPRLVLWGVARLQGRKRMGQIDLDRLTQAVGVLAATDGGVGPVKLLQSGESADHLAPLLGLLLFYDIADISKAGDRVWLSSDARRKMLQTVGHQS